MPVRIRGLPVMFFRVTFWGGLEALSKYNSAGAKATSPLSINTFEGNGARLRLPVT